MCGIVGSISTDQVQPDALLSGIAHRGPDDRGYVVEGPLLLGHTRLSILDLSERGHQPMYSADGRYVIIFNGEIYNHLDIRQQHCHDYPFAGSSDTETILAAWSKFGLDTLPMLNGIFAFAMYDRQEQVLTLARDHFGVKPLYVYRDKERMLFGSEIKSFLTQPLDRSLDPTAFSAYLTYLWSPGERTPFKGVRKLLPGHYMQFALSDWRQAEPVRYYRMPYEGVYDAPDEAATVDRLEAALLAAVKRQMLSDVPVGFFLSGGLDSSLLVAMARKIRPDYRLPCFTIDTGILQQTEGLVDDLQYARRVAEYLDVDLQVVKADIDILRDFDRMVWYLDEPQADAAPLNVYNICREARAKGIKVLIGGAAGDDLFSGYRRHQAIRLESAFNVIPAPLRSLIAAAGKRLPAAHPVMRRIRKIALEMDKDSAGRLAGYFAWLPSERVRGLFAPSWRPFADAFDPAAPFISALADIPQEKNWLNRMLYWESLGFLPDHNLNYTDKLSMATGVEARVPFLDTELVAVATRIHPSLKMKGSETKYILKKVAERYLPREVIYRPKTGFGAPVRQWITRDLDGMLRERLAPERIRERGIFDADAVWRLIEDNRAGRIDASYPIWGLLAIESWLRQFADTGEVSKTALLQANSTLS